jgi:3-methyl-2-oxobutanoate hydroxymethyltransferase
VITDVLGLSADFTPKHARHYAELHTIIKAAAESYRDDVAAGTFPGPAESVRMDESILDQILGRTTLDRAVGAEAGNGIPLDRDL